MSDKYQETAQRMADWGQQLARMELPDWEQLPQFDLYMDQLLELLTRWLAPCFRTEDAGITASAINNYVRMKIVPPPTKKKYSRVHLAELVILCTLKQSLSIASVRRILPDTGDEAQVQALYQRFVRQFRDARKAFCGHAAAPAEELLLPIGGEDPALTAALYTTLAKSLTESLLRDDTAE
ncbi:MAG: DUF1836 domain-containing protein [Faecalibacterium sp.]